MCIKKENLRHRGLKKNTHSLSWTPRPYTLVASYKRKYKSVPEKLVVQTAG